MRLRVCAALAALPSVAAILLGASVLPHGDFSLLPSLLPAGSTNRTLAQQLHDAAFATADLVAAQAPDVVLLIAPHAAALSVDFAVYANSNNSGTALIGGDLHNASTPLVPFSVATRGAPDTAAGLVASLQALHANVSALSFWADSEPAPLRWSEVVPLTFLASVTNSSASGTPPGVVVWSQPLRRYNCSSCMVPELLRLGGQLFPLLMGAPQRVWVVVSADLAHTHPAAVNPYPPNATAAVAFDAAIGKWAATLSRDALDAASAVADDALSCGFTGIVLLHGLLSGAPGGTTGWAPKLFAGPSAPTYYGMLVSSIVSYDAGAGAAVRRARA